MHCVTFREINCQTKKNGFKDINKTIVQPNDTGILPFIARQCKPIKMSQMLPSQEAAILQNISNQASELALAVRGQIYICGKEVMISGKSWCMERTWTFISYRIHRKFAPFFAQIFAKKFVKCKNLHK